MGSAKLPRMDGHATPRTPSGSPRLKNASSAMRLSDRPDRIDAPLLMAGFAQLDEPADDSGEPVALGRRAIERGRQERIDADAPPGVGQEEERGGHEEHRVG